jgi:hypothetical protein
MRQLLMSSVLLCLLCQVMGCVSGAEEATGVYDGDASFLLTFAEPTSSLYRLNVPIVPLEGEEQIVIVGWDGYCRAEAVVDGLDLAVSPSVCAFPFQDGVLRLTYEGVGDLSDSGKLDLELSGTATYIPEGGGAAEGTFSFTFSGRRQD